MPRTQKLMPLIAILSTFVFLVFHTVAFGQQRERPRVDIGSLFTPSGYMGDGEFGSKYIVFSGADGTAPHSAPSSVKITYSVGPNRWAGIYWQNVPDNWGDRPGTNYAGRGLSKVSFWARGEVGNEVVEFKAGGIDKANKKYRDSFEAKTGRLTLTKEWKQYEIDLRDANLGSVIGAFSWVVSADFNTGKRVTFYLDDMYLE